MSFSLFFLIWTRWPEWRWGPQTCHRCRRLIRPIKRRGEECLKKDAICLWSFWTLKIRLCLGLWSHPHFISKGRGRGRRSSSKYWGPLVQCIGCIKLHIRVLLILGYSKLLQWSNTLFWINNGWRLTCSWPDSPTSTGRCPSWIQSVVRNMPFWVHVSSWVHSRLHHVNRDTEKKAKPKAAGWKQEEEEEREIETLERSVKASNLPPNPDERS